MQDIDFGGLIWYNVIQKFNLACIEIIKYRTEREGIYVKHNRNQKYYKRI